MARQHLDELRQELQDMGWVVESVDPSPDTHLCGIWMLRHRSGALRCVEFTAASKGSKRFEESHGCHLQNAKAHYAYFSAIPSQWRNELKRMMKYFSI